MKNFSKVILLFFCSVPFVNTSYALAPRGTIWGFGGSEPLARADIMVPVFGNSQQIAWADLGGKYGNEGTWLASLGAGYRQVYQGAQVLGVYGFMDYNISPRGNAFWVASPGIESLGNCWDFHLNGYFPVSKRTKKIGEAWAGDFGDSRFISFTGHQQYDHLFNLVENTGRGVDGEIGRTFPCLHFARFYLGGYYFNLHNKDDIRNDDFSDHHNRFSSPSIQGISGRLEYPLNSHVVLQAVDTYDNFAHNTALVGLQISYGGYTRQTYPVTAPCRILDPVSRNLGTQYTGNSVPIVEKIEDQGAILLVRDNIYFFSTQSTGGNGTFEQPFSGSQFNQPTIDGLSAISPINNFYFTPGTYPFDPTNPNARISLHIGQSMWGRTADYTLPAQGDYRAFFIGGIDLGVNFAAGNNRLDSIRVLDASTTNGTVNNIIRTIEIEGATNVVFFNDEITANATVAGTLDFGVINTANAIYANGSQVVIKDSDIVANANVLGDNDYVNFATSIGGNVDFSNSTNFVGNTFTVINSIISASAHVSGDNVIENFATGVGGNAAFELSSNFVDNTRMVIKNSNVSGTATTDGNNFFANFAAGIGGNNNAGFAEFNGNIFTLLNDTIQATAIVRGSNVSDSPFGFGPGQNFAVGLGSNSIFEGDANFINNQFIINNCNINATATLFGSNAASGSGNLTANSAAGIGSNVSNDVNPTTANFLNNTFTIENSNVSSLATINGNNSGWNFSTGIGGNVSTETVSGTTANFIGNDFTIATSNIAATANVLGSNAAPGGLNFATGIGGNAPVPGPASFIDNIFNITGSTISATASSGSGGTTVATGVIVDGGGNLVTIDNSSLNVLAIGGANTARGLFATGPLDLIEISNSTLSVLAPGGTAICKSGNVTSLNTTCDGMPQ